MNPRALRGWVFVHKWTSVICTAFLLMLCVTGLPLIFHHEIDAAFGEDPFRPANPDGPRLGYNAMLASALANRPGEVPLFMSFDTDRPVVNVTTAPRPDSPESDIHFASFDLTSGALVPPHEPDGGVMHFLLHLHTDMFLGLPGMLFLGVMGLMFMASVMSGVVLYAPFMRRMPFGTVRASRSPRVKWLDWHNLLGIVTVAWVSVVGLTGVINTLADPIFTLWRFSELADLMDEHRGDATPPARMASLDAAIAGAEAAAPGMVLQFVAFPGGSFSTAHHYAIFLHGATPLTQHILAPVLVDAETGAVAGLREMPWYAKALALSKPLHFGDYGGLPLKILWALMTLATLIVLGSGLYLWLGRRAPVPVRGAARPDIAPLAGGAAAE